MKELGKKVWYECPRHRELRRGDILDSIDRECLVSNGTPTGVWVYKDRLFSSRKELISSILAMGARSYEL